MPLRKSNLFNLSPSASKWLKLIDNLLLSLSLILLGLLIFNYFNKDLFLKAYEILFNVLWISFSLEFIIKFFLAKNKLGYLRKDIFLPVIILFPFLRPLSLLPISEFGLLVFADQIDDRFPIFRRWRILETLLLLVVVIVIFSNLFLLVETEPGTRIHSFGDALWFSLVTIATVGYGDIYPKSFYGRILALVLMIIGISLFSTIIARVSSFFVETETKPLLDLEEKEMGKVEIEEKNIELLAENLAKENKVIEAKLEKIENKLDKKES